MRWIFIVLGCVVGFSSPASGQSNAELDYSDRVYLPNIMSVTLSVAGTPLAYPVVPLNGGNFPLILEFDDLDGDTKNYTYSIIQCDMDWQPSQLVQMEYIDGFGEENIRDFQFSFKTTVAYTHYTLAIPNNSMRWTKSGNYVLIVYEDEQDRIPAITRRFMVVDQRVEVNAEQVRPSQVSKMRTHQEIDFIVNHERMPLRSPMQEVKAVVLQNGRWDNAITGITPQFSRINTLVFDFQDKIVFPAGKEFRQLDLRSLRTPAGQVQEVYTSRDGNEVMLYKDRARDGDNYLEYRDINGNFVLGTQDQNNQLAADYAQVLFTLYAPTPYFDENVYLVGKFTDWRLEEYYKMVYNPSVNGYVLKTPLKQGFYNYAYAVTPSTKGNKPAPGVLQLSQIEGDSFETENDYLILIYYRPFGGRYDQIIGYHTLKTRQ
ncbi:MAG: DUF5103 domain-containing protein [Lewinellaceae bacterium]|nr:DUF5103 domain-containing protein [Lewinellaceae bacterium]